MSGFITTDAALTKDQAEAMKAAWKRLSGLTGAHDIAVIENGKFVPISFPPEDSQFLQSRAFQVRDYKATE